MDSNNIRIKDIARMAGVSVGTVDRVIHNRGRVSPNALEKIMSVLDKTGYKPNMLARTLGSNKKYLIAAIVPEPSMDEYWEISNEGINEARKEWSQYNIVVQTFYFDLYDKNSFKKSAKDAIETNPDGIIASPVFHHEASDFFTSFTNESIPFVFFNNKIPEVKPFSFIGQDFHQSGKLGAELLDLITDAPGSLGILHIYEDIQNSVHLAQKEAGFKEYFIQNNSREFMITSMDLRNPDKESLRQGLKSLLDDKSIKGLYVTTSNGTYLAANYLRNSNRNDLRLVGYDTLSGNIHYLNEGVIDFLIDQNPRRQAALGISYLANYLSFKKISPEEYLFPLEVITRQNVQSFLNTQPQVSINTAGVMN